MKTYPIMLNLDRRLAVVVGGGSVGLRKVRSLLAVGARVRLVDPALGPGDVDASVEVCREPYSTTHLEGAAIVFGCTDDHALNARITADARQIGAWVNAADQPDDCDFFVPAVATSGDIVVAVGTGGASPALAGLIRDKAAEALGPDIGEFAAALADIRIQLLQTVDSLPRRSAILKRLASAQALDAFRAGGRVALDTMTRQLANESEADDAV